MFNRLQLLVLTGLLSFAAMPVLAETQGNKKAGEQRVGAKGLSPSQLGNRHMTTIREFKGHIDFKSLHSNSSCHTT